MNEPPIIPHVRISAHGPGLVSDEDRDNFVRNLLTVLHVGGVSVFPSSIARVVGSSPLSKAATGNPVVPLDMIKSHLRIEQDQTAEDDYLVFLEKAARVYTAAVLRRDTVDDTVGENVKEAMLLLIAHWYRNRESVGADALAQVPLAFTALLSTERDYSEAY